MAELETRSLVRRIADFPLVAMLIAIALYACAAALAVIIQRALPPMARNERIPIEVLLNVALLLAAYKLVVRRLGEHPRDDLAARGGLRDLGLGLIGGFI